MVTHRRRTDVKAGFCSNVDFVVLTLAARGPTRAKDLYAALASWRPEKGPLRPNGQAGWATHLFNREYSYVACSASEPDVRRPGYTKGSCSKPLWYRVSRGVYALNQAGWLRAAGLQ